MAGAFCFLKKLEKLKFLGYIINKNNMWFMQIFKKVMKNKITV